MFPLELEQPSYLSCNFSKLEKKALIVYTYSILNEKLSEDSSLDFLVTKQELSNIAAKRAMKLKYPFRAKMIIELV